LANGEKVPIKGHGHVSMDVAESRTEMRMVLGKAMIVPRLTSDLLSVRTVHRNCGAVVFVEKRLLHPQRRGCCPFEWSARRGVRCRRGQGPRAKRAQGHAGQGVGVRGIDAHRWKGGAVASSVQPLGVGEPQAGWHNCLRNAVVSCRRQARHWHCLRAMRGRTDSSGAQPPLVDSEDQVQTGAHQGSSWIYFRGLYPCIISVSTSDTSRGRISQMQYEKRRRGYIYPV